MLYAKIRKGQRVLVRLGEPDRYSWEPGIVADYSAFTAIVRVSAGRHTMSRDMEGMYTLDRLTRDQIYGYRSAWSSLALAEAEHERRRESYSLPRSQRLG